MIQRSWFQTPLGAIFDKFLFCSSLCKDLSDNLTEMPYREKLKYYFIYIIQILFQVRERSVDGVGSCMVVVERI